MAATVVSKGGKRKDVYNFSEAAEDNAGASSKIEQDEEDLTCDLCGRKCATSPGLKRHRRACERTYTVKQEEEIIEQEEENEGEVEEGEEDEKDGHIIIDYESETEETEEDTEEDTEYIIPDMESSETIDVSTFEFVTATALNGDSITEFSNKCDCCGDDLESAHLMGDYACEDCNWLFETQQSLNRHRAIVHQMGSVYSCNNCDVICFDKKSLSKHVNSSHEDLKPVSCPVCGKRFSRKYHLIRHNLQTGCGGAKKSAYPCMVCSRIFARKDNLREHLRAHAGETKRKKRYTCEYCNEEFVGASKLKQHIRTHVEHVTGEKRYGCDMCEKRFSSNAAMKKHRRRHTGERPFDCGKCGATFSAKETLNRHMRIHSGQKPHICPHCGKSFIQAIQLRAHIFHHTGENGFECEHCGKVFNRKTRLELHVKFVHEGAEPYHCNVCNKDFVRKEDLNRHDILHSGIKAHKCPVCDKGFAMKASLKLHLLTHTKEPPRSCDECGRAFIRQDCLLRHMRTRHRDTLEKIMVEAEERKMQARMQMNASNGGMMEGVYEEGEDGDLGGDEFTPFMSDEALADAISQLLTLLVDEDTLKTFGWPDATVDTLLEGVIKRCGHISNSMDDLPYAECLRENAKLLFTVVIDDEAVKNLLNKQTVDEVILHVLKLAKAS